MSEANQAATVKTPLTKEQKLANIDAQIAKLQARRADIEAGRDTKAKKEVYVPAKGDKVIATIGRNTATSQAKSVEGTVLAVKVPAEGEKGATQVRVRIYEGEFDEQTVTLYPAQLQAVKAEPADAEPSDDGISNAPLGSLVNA